MGSANFSYAAVHTIYAGRFSMWTIGTAAHVSGAPAGRRALMRRGLHVLDAPLQHLGQAALAHVAQELAAVRGQQPVLPGFRVRLS